MRRRSPRDPDEKRDAIANGDRDPPPGWPGRAVGVPSDLVHPAMDLTTEARVMDQMEAGLKAERAARALEPWNRRGWAKRSTYR